MDVIRGTEADSRRRPRVRVVACAIGAAMLLVGGAVGCSSRGAHARMSAGEIEDRLEDEFPVGSPRAAVMAELLRRGASYDAPLPLEEPAGWTTLRVYLEQPWWAGLRWATTYEKTKAWADMLFDEAEVLQEVQAEVREQTW